MMRSSLDEILPLYWHTEYMNAWRLSLEKNWNKGLLLRKVLPYLPRDRGHIEFIEDYPGEQFIVLFTHDNDSPGACQNESWILLTLAETGAITFFGIEGLAGELSSLEDIQSFPDNEIIKLVSSSLMRSSMIHPVEYLALNCRDPIFIWGIEDPNCCLGSSENKSYYTNSDVLFSNLLSKMSEIDVSVAPFH